MKKLIAALLMLAIVSFAMAEPNVTIFGEHVFDYDITEDMLDGDDPALGGFNMPKALIGADVELSDKVTGHFTYRMRMNMLRMAYVDWKILDNLIFSAGRFKQVFAPESEWYDNSVNKVEGVGIAFDAGEVNLAFQAANKIENPDKKNTGEALYLMPAVTYKTAFDSTSLTIGTNAKYITAYDDTYGEADPDSHFLMNAYSSVVSGNFSGLVSADFNELQDSDLMNIDINTDFTYKINKVIPGLMMEMHDVVHDTNDMQLDMEVYAKIMAAKGLVIKPIIGLDNISEANNADFTKMFTMKFIWKPKYKFN